MNLRKKVKVMANISRESLENAIDNVADEFIDFLRKIQKAKKKKLKK